MSLKVMNTLGYAAKENVTRGPCLACGKPVEYRVNMKGMVYYFCPHVSSSNVYCADHHKWGSANSDAIMLKAKGSTAPVPKPEPVAPVKVPKQDERRDTGDGFF